MFSVPEAPVVRPNAEELKQALERFRMASLTRVSLLPSPDSLSAAFNSWGPPSNSGEVSDLEAMSVFPNRILACWGQLVDAHNAAVSEARFAEMMPRFDCTVFEMAWPDQLCQEFSPIGD
jgi:hypothetical protein